METQQVQQIIDGVQTGLNKASEALGVALPHVWEVLIRQQYAEAVETLIWLIPILIVTYFLVKCIRFLFNENTDNNDDGTAIIVCSIALVVIWLVYLSEFGGAVKKLINPEYYAVKEIVSYLETK